MEIGLIKCLVGLIIASLISSCIVYIPQSVDIPLISNKNELKIDGGISLLPSANATVSYGLTNKIAIQVFGSTTPYFQGAVGYFKDLGNQKAMELYGGFGSGYGDAYRDASGGHLKGGYNLYFAQLNFGKIKSKDSHLDYGLGVKAGLLHSNLTNRNYYNDFTESVPLEKYIDNSFLLEPNFFVRLGGERLKFNIKLGTCWIYKFTHTDKYLPYSYLNLGLSMNYKFGK